MHLEGILDFRALFFTIIFFIAYRYIFSGEEAVVILTSDKNIHP